MGMSSRLYVGRLSWRASASDLEQFFRGYGRINDIILKNGFAFVELDDPRDAEDAVHDLNGRELCGERVTIEFTRPARARFGRLDRFLPPRRNCYKYGPPVQTPHRLLVENLSSGCAWQILLYGLVVQAKRVTCLTARTVFFGYAMGGDVLPLAAEPEGRSVIVSFPQHQELKDLMRTAGEVTFADAHKIRVREGVVCFATREGLERALDRMQGKEINGRKLKLTDVSDKRYARSRSRQRSRSRSRSRCSRSRSSHNSVKSSPASNHTDNEDEACSLSRSEERAHGANSERMDDRASSASA
ncbi:unnamed protein product [Toxocara canis]|uniref:RRM domain-containing protein n=1 Tax=Toxocara canis TaxID=6265 RepID=A0A183UHT5_TOXCA|nr:unnamed protein product [Toxocara canis]